MSRVRGPTSALTEFLKERGIRAPAKSRFEKIEQTVEQATENSTEAPSLPPAKRKIAPGASMNFDEDDEQDMEPAVSKKQAPTSVKIGERVACGRCSTVFSATRYTRMDPSLGPLCIACKDAVPKPAVQVTTSEKKRAPKRSRNIVETQLVIPSLQSVTINVIAQHIDRTQALGGLSARNLDALSKVISKNRRLNDDTMQLFLTPETRRLALYDCSAVTSDAFQSIATFAPHVTDLLLHYCGQLDNAAFESLFQLAIQSIDLYGPYLVRKEIWLTFLTEHGHRLKRLKLRETPRFDRACIEALVKYAPQLSELGLAQIGALDDDGARELHALTNLTYLDLSQPGVSAPSIPPKSLHADTIVYLLQNLHTTLLTLRLDFNAEITDKFCSALEQCRNMKVLSMEGALGITSDAWKTCFENMNKCALEEVALGNCHLSDEAFIALINAAPNLRFLSIKYNQQLSSSALVALAEHAPPLQVLEVSFVRSVDDAVLQRLVDALPTLDTLYIFGCNQVRPSFRSDKVTIVGREREV
ncbi:UV-damaged DNA-binding protein rad7 [Malassezia yamatoensis]|uniref:UV-damaged DNA-binding protein rad7 n=1 Tax=Malassezia yamatoensis TaxID=253288 RepID=A0AAJ5Z292_9BASI|nr:UV-damaged DNA-binding protein rad7 [Malassezia yamatoensis]